MTNNLPPRPNLDHLRRQAKSLLAALEAGDTEAAATFRSHLPAARGMNADQMRAAGFRLADAQSAIARKTGFAGWPQLARHVEQLRALEGTWEFATLEVDGRTMPAAMLSTSRLLIDGDRFRTESPEAVYEGVFNIDVEADPHGIDIDFVEGPEAGNRNQGVFRFTGDRLEICLDTTGRSRPGAFRTTPNSGHALETLRRASAARPSAVTGGTPQPRPEPAPVHDGSGFEHVPGPTLALLQGEWGATRLVRDGQELPATMVSIGHRWARDNEVKVTFGGQVVIHALVRIDEGANPVAVDYYSIGGQPKGSVQHGIMRWVDGEACFCMAMPGQPRPTDFACPAGSGHTLSQWRRT